MGMSVTPHLIKIEDKTRIIGQVSDGGQFVWSLKPGKYFIYKMHYRDSWSGNYFVIPKVAFEVPKKGNSYYIGTLKCEFEPKRDFLGTILEESCFLYWMKMIYTSPIFRKGLV